MSYRNKIISGFSWQSLQKVFVAVLSFAKIYVLARLLSPDDFGLFSLTMIALGITESFTQTGINTTIIQSKHSVKYFIDTAWVIAIIRGFLIGSLMIAMGFLMGNYYQEEQLFSIIAVTALVPVIKGFINPAIVKWQKSFNFSKDSLYHSALLLIEALAQIALALLLHSVWAMALGVIISAIFEVLLSFLILKEKPVFKYLKSRGDIIFENARWLSVGSLFHYLNDNVDDFLLGKIVGTYNLGIYHNAYSLSHKANYELAKSAYHGVFPALTELTINKKKKEMKRIFLKTTMSTLLIAAVVSIPLIIFSEFFVNLILGEQWVAAIPILRILTIAGLVQAISNMCLAVIISQKKYIFMNLQLFVSLGIMTLGIIILGGKNGLVGASWGIVLARLISLPIAIYGAKKSLD